VAYLIDSTGSVATTSTTGANAVGSSNNVARIGAGTSSASSLNAAYFLNGWVSEILIYNRVLSGTEITSVNEYLNAKYIPEPATISLLAMGVMGLFVRRGK
jgi:glutamyl-tRNA reductase